MVATSSVHGWSSTRPAHGSDEVRRLDDPAVAPCLRLTKGVHIVVPRSRVDNRFAVVLRAPRDRRILFVIPWDDRTLIGTTDTDFTGSPDTVSVDPEDLEYLLEAVNAFYPQARLVPSDVVGSFAELRPLVAPEDTRNPSAVSREERILRSPSGLVTLAEGKLTISNHIISQLGGKPTRRRRRHHKVPLAGGAAHKNGHRRRRVEADRLQQRYGERAPEVMALMQERPDLSHPLVAGMPYTKGEAVYSVQG